MNEKYKKENEFLKKNSNDSIIINNNDDDNNWIKGNFFI